MLFGPFISFCLPSFPFFPFSFQFRNDLLYSLIQKLCTICKHRVIFGTLGHDVWQKLTLERFLSFFIMGVRIFGEP